MPIRKFLVASSVARLIQRELGSEWRVEGYLNGGDYRRTHVVLEGNDGHLMLEEEVDGNLTVEDTLVPRRQGEALLVACVGRLDIDRTTMTIGHRPAVLDRISSAGKTLDLLTVHLDEGPNPRTFYPPGWVGREISDGSCDARVLATAGITTDPRRL